MRIAKIILCLGLVCAAGCRSVEKDPVDYVDPTIGNISHLLVPTYPTVHMPNGMMRIYPERADYTSDRVKGLPLIVTSHRGRSAFNLSFFMGEPEKTAPYYKYHYDNEVIKPYYYSVFFEEPEVEARFAPSYHSGVYELSFPEGEAVSLVFNTKKGELKFDENAVSGYQELKGNTRVYIYAEFSSRVQNVKEESDHDNRYLVFTFPENDRKIGIRYGVSFIDATQAQDNLREEIPDFDVDALAAWGRDIWNETLGKIKVSGIDESAKTVFYTSLYRTYERMVCISEGDRYFSAHDGQVHVDREPFYTDDWVWDTYRAAHPLRLIIEREKEKHMLNSYARMSEQLPGNWMPTFPEVTGDSRRMNSNHGVACVADAVYKGLDGIDVESLYRYCKAGITEKTLAPWSGVKGGGLTEFYWKHGYIPALDEGEKEKYDEVHHMEKRQPIAVTLGTAYDQWCLSRIASAIGNEQDARLFADGSLNYRTVWNDRTKFFHPKNERGEFLEPYDYVRGGGQGARMTYDENNAWVYRWDVQHDITNLVNMMGGAKAFVKNLDTMFDTPLGSSKFDFYSQLPDHTGNVGQFSMANEPALHIPYLYNYAGAPWKTQKRIRTLLKQWFRNDLMGIPGDEDGGGMTAFVVFSMMGFYPVTPGLPMYNIGSPVFEDVSIDLGKGKYFRIHCNNYSPDNKYIQSAKLNGQVLNRCWFTHEELSEGGVLEFVMGDRPEKQWASDSVPPSFTM